jgi:hypothetical protein
MNHSGGQERYWLVFVGIAIAVVGVAHPYAYVDPGAASYLFQVIAGVALGAIFVVRTYWTRLKASVARVLRKRRGPA